MICTEYPAAYVVPSIFNLIWVDRFLLSSFTLSVVFHLTLSWLTLLYCTFFALNCPSVLLFFLFSSIVVFLGNPWSIINISPFSLSFQVQNSVFCFGVFIFPIFSFFSLFFCWMFFVFYLLICCFLNLLRVFFLFPQTQCESHLP